MAKIANRDYIRPRMRQVELNLYAVGDLDHVKAHVPKTLAWRTFEKGSLRSSGRGVYPENAIAIWIEVDRPNETEHKVERLLEELGGAEGIGRLLVISKAREAWVRFVVPVRTSEFVEDFSLSPSVVQKVAALGLGLEFWYK